MTSRGIVSAAAYLPHRRLDRSTIAAVAGTGGGKGTRTVASYDEDTTTMGVEAARAALRPLDGVIPHTLWFSTVAPAYLDKTNATVIHAALQLGRDVGAFDADGSVRSAMGALRAALGGRGSHLVVTADLRIGLAGGPDESAVGDGAAALVIGDERDGPVIAELLGGGWATEEFLDRWRTPGDDPLEGVGGALRRDALRPPRPGGLGRCPEDGGAGGRPGRPGRHRRDARPRQRRAGQEAVGGRPARRATWATRSATSAPPSRPSCSRRRSRLPDQGR